MHFENSDVTSPYLSHHHRTRRRRRRRSHHHHHHHHLFFIVAFLFSTKDVLMVSCHCLCSFVCLRFLTAS
jgi:hypothetical protein